MGDRSIAVPVDGCSSGIDLRSVCFRSLGRGDQEFLIDLLHAAIGAVLDILVRCEFSNS